MGKYLLKVIIKDSTRCTSIFTDTFNKYFLLDVATITQQTNTCSKSTMETLAEGVKYIQN